MATHNASGSSLKLNCVKFFCHLISEKINILFWYYSYYYRKVLVMIVTHNTPGLSSVIKFIKYLCNFIFKQLNKLFANFFSKLEYMVFR